MRNNTNGGKTRKASTPILDPRAAVRYAGYCDAQQGLGFRREYETMHPADQRNYERGRQQFFEGVSLTKGRGINWYEFETFTTAVSRLMPAGRAYIFLMETSASSSFWSARPEAV